MKSMRKGFTLIELLIVVVIIGILAAIAIPKFANTKSKAYIAAMKSDLRNLVTAEESYFSDSAKYATDTAVNGMKFKPSTGVSMPTISTFSGAWLATNTHSQLANFSCGIGVNTTNPLVSTAGDGEPVCK
jgi:prepilin-type N-terminal cleavage/methylation domain-containing protein